MRLLIPLSLLLLETGLLSISAAPTTPDAFLAALKTAIQAKSQDQMNALTYTTGMTDADKAQAAKIDSDFVFASEMTNISLIALPADFQTVYIANGKKIEPTCQPTGLVKVDLKAPGNGSQSTEMGYAIVDGTYYLVTSKTTDLGWKGPPDKTLSFMVMGEGQNSVQIHANWNASGVEQERNFKSPSTGFMGQYFENVTVTSTDDTTNVTLTLMENGKQIYVSPPLKGKGTIAYKKS